MAELPDIQDFSLYACSLFAFSDLSEVKTNKKFVTLSVQFEFTRCQEGEGGEREGIRGGEQGAESELSSD